MHPFFARLPGGRIVLLALLLMTVSCGGSRSGDELGEAYVAPATLNLRRDLVQKNSVVAVLKHGERVEIIDVRRRFVRVRTSKGQEGWIDSLQLLSTEQMEQIRREAEEARKLPSEGSATVFEELNIHIEPDRRSPAFAQIKEGTYVDVLARRLTPKETAALRPPSLIKERPQALSRRGRKAASRSGLQLPPPPPPPKAPANWQELSSERIDGGESTADLKTNKDSRAADLKKPTVLESWTLVRTKEKQCGWALSRNLTMAIPDEVAQYAEGKHITSYFDLGEVKDEEKGAKHNWLWTTASGGAPYDFDAWRVFLWNRHRHRYETSYRMRDLEGYFPVRVDPVDPNVFGRTFHLITKDEDGKLRVRTYVFDSMRVHLSGMEDYGLSGAGSQKGANGIDVDKLQAKKPQEGWFLRKWREFRRKTAPSG